MKIVAASIQIPNASGFTNYVMYPPARHHDIIHWLHEELGKGWTQCGQVQGFIDEDENFRTREEAARIALAAGQVKIGMANIKHEFDGRKLFSEDCW